MGFRGRDADASTLSAILSICFRAFAISRPDLPPPALCTRRSARCAFVSFLRISALSFRLSGSPGQSGPTMASSRQSSAVAQAGSVVVVVSGRAREVLVDGLRAGVVVVV